MFAKPEWFHSASMGLGLRPATWQGWLYSAAWTAGLLLPAAALVSQHKGWEALIWLAAGSWMLVHEARSTLREKRRADLFVIDEDTDVTKKVATENYDLELRR